MAQLYKGIHQKADSLFHRWRRFTGEWKPYVEDALPSADVTLQMQQASVPSFGFFFMLGLATAIATFGLIANSTPAIIGAMIIAPLMAPIMSLSYGLVLAQRRLIGRSIATVIAGVIVVVVIAYFSTRLIGLRITGSEVLNRTSPTLLDLGVALAAGGAAAFSYTRRSIANSIAGVAIAVALVPPLAVCGIGLALGRKAVTETGLSLSEFGLFSGGTDIAVGAFLLFVTNFIGIVAVATLIFISQRYGVWKKALLGLGLFIGLSALLVQPLDEGLHRLWVKSKVVRLSAKLAANRPDIVSGRGKVESIHVTYQDGVLHVNADGFGAKDRFDDLAAAQERLDLFRKYLTVEIGEPVVVEIDVIPVEMLQLRSEPPGLRTEDAQSEK